MPVQPLPPGYRTGSARYETLPAGSLLWRLHDAEYTAWSFAPPLKDDIFEGNRFDGTPTDPFPFHYSAEQQITALAEVLLRDRPFDEKTATRIIPASAVAGRVLAPVETTAPLELISLITAEDQAAVCQDKWLFEAEEAELIRVRRWTAQLRKAERRAKGLVWASRRDHPRRAYVLFGDRCGDEPLKPASLPVLDFSRRSDVAVANRLLRGLRAVIDTDYWPE